MRQELVITPRHKLSLGLSELWVYRELIYMFAWREVKVKYKQTAIGVLWVVLQPVAMMVILQAFLSRALGMVTGTPYPLFVLSGLVAWNLFASSTSGAVNNILSHANVIKKIYFPRLIIPISTLLATLLDFGIMWGTLGIFMVFYQPGLLLGIQPLKVVAGIAVVILFSLALSLYFSALVAKYRDFRYALNFLVQILFFLSPVIYTAKLLPLLWQKVIFYFNPMALGIELFRSGMLGLEVGFSLVEGLASMCIAIAYFLVGLYTFRKAEEYMADYL
ncbi:MAG: ABC transporter permease [Bacteroidia bacterium]